MSAHDIEFYGLEGYDCSNVYEDNSCNSIICLFKTNRVGIYQVKYKKLEDGWKLKPLKNEPNIQVLTKKEQLYIEKVCRIVWRMIDDVPAATDRFE